MFWNKNTVKNLAANLIYYIFALPFEKRDKFLQNSDGVTIIFLKDTSEKILVKH
jgi:hypothetical protein